MANLGNGGDEDGGRYCLNYKDYKRPMTFDWIDAYKMVDYREI